MKKEEIIQIKDPDGNLLFPKTKASAVYTKNGKTFENVDSNAQENVIEKILINGKEQIVKNKTVDLDINRILDTVSYNDIDDKPSINNVVIEGNKSLDDFGIAAKTDLDDLADKVKVNIDNHRVRLDALEDSVDTINADIKTTNDNLDDTIEFAKSIETNVETLRVDLTNTQNKLDTVESKAVINGLDINRLDERVSKLETSDASNFIAGKGITITEESKESGTDNYVISLSENYVTTTEFDETLGLLSDNIIKDLNTLDENKQNKLLPGYGIKIVDNIISVYFKESDISGESGESGDESWNESGNVPLEIDTSNLNTDRYITLNDITKEKHPRILINSQDMVVSSNNLCDFIYAGNYLQLSKESFGLYQLTGADLGLGYQQLNPGYLKAEDLTVYAIDENTEWWSESPRTEWYVPYEYEQYMVDVYKEDGTVMEAFELWSDAFCEDKIGGSTAFFRIGLLDAFNLDQRSDVRLIAVDPSYYFGMKAVPYLAACIQNYQGRWACLFGYQFYEVNAKVLKNGNGLSRYRIDLKHELWSELHSQGLAISDLDSEISRLENQVEHDTSSIATVSNRVFALQDRVSALETKTNVISNLNTDSFVIFNGTTYPAVRINHSGIIVTTANLREFFTSNSLNINTSEVMPISEEVFNTISIDLFTEDKENLTLLSTNKDLFNKLHVIDTGIEVKDWEPTDDSTDNTLATVKYIKQKETALTESVTNITSDITTLEQTIATLTETITTLTNKITALENDDRVIETYRTATSFYRKYASGWVEQGGYSSNNTGNQVVTIPLLIEMLDTNYNIQLTRRAAQNQVLQVYEESTNDDSKTTTSFDVYWEGATGAFYWYVCGDSKN